MTTCYDALIVGGGVAGASCAILLARAGWSVALVEKQTFPRRKVCGECIAASNLALIDGLGIGREFRVLAGPPLQRAGWYSGEARIEGPLPRMAGAPEPWGRALGREHLDTLLLVRARELGVSVLQPWTARMVERVEGWQRCIASGPSRVTRKLEAPLLIAAQGSWQPGSMRGHERVWRKRGSDLLAFKANFSAARLPAGVLPVLAFRGGYGGMVQGDHGLLTIACCIRRDQLRRSRDTYPGRGAGEAVQAVLCAEIRAVRETLDGARREGGWLAAGPIRPRIGAAHPEPGVFAVGNAAGEAHPILGEGISMAMQSAFLLCERLISGEALARADYPRAWRRSFAPRIRLAAVYAHAAMQPAATRALLPVLSQWPGLLSLGARLGGKVRCAIEPGAVTPGDLSTTTASEYRDEHV